MCSGVQRDSVSRLAHSADLATYPAEHFTKTGKQEQKTPSAAESHR